MSEHPRRILYLIVGDLPADRLSEITAGSGAETEVIPLTETNGREALDKIFAADTVAVWGPVDGHNALI